jgi:hypothetical protein
MEKNQIFYLATTPNYAPQNRFEFGGTDLKSGLRQRINNYNVGRAEGDLFYYTKFIYCNDFKAIEGRVKSLLARFLDKPNGKKEMVHMRSDCLVTVIEFICENYDQEIDFLNQWCEDFFNKTIDEDPIIPEPLDPRTLFEKDHIEISLQRNGQKHTQKIDISDWTEDQIYQKITEIVELCARKEKPDYNFDEQKNVVAVQLSWVVITEFMKAYKGFTMTQWRELFKGWYATQNPKKLHIKGLKV